MWDKLRHHVNSISNKKTSFFFPTEIFFLGHGLHVFRCFCCPTAATAGSFFRRPDHHVGVALRRTARHRCRRHPALCWVVFYAANLCCQCCLNHLPWLLPGALLRLLTVFVDPHATPVSSWFRRQHHGPTGRLFFAGAQSRPLLRRHQYVISFDAFLQSSAIIRP